MNCSLRRPVNAQDCCCPRLRLHLPLTHHGPTPRHETSPELTHDTRASIRLHGGCFVALFVPSRIHSHGSSELTVEGPASPPLQEVSRRHEYVDGRSGLQHCDAVFNFRRYGVTIAGN